MVELPDDAIEVVAQALADLVADDRHVQAAELLQRIWPLIAARVWAESARHPADGNEAACRAWIAELRETGNAMMADDFQTMLDQCSAVRAEAVAQLAEALGEPLGTPGDHPGEPPYRMTWERALDIARGRTAVWSDLLRRAAVADAEWLTEYRGRAGAAAPDPVAEAVAGERQRVTAVAVELTTITERAVVRGGYRAGEGERVETLWQQLGVVLPDGSVPVATPEPTARDERPHSRACGLRQHEHGSACAVDCPTCAAGGGWHYPVATPDPWSPLRNRVDWLRDQHARYHDQPGNMLGRDECGWEPCRFWDGAEWVLGARSSGPVATPTEPAKRCDGTLGTRPYWMGVDQYDPCRCWLPAGHTGDHQCEHENDGVTPPFATSPVPAVQPARPEPDLLTALQRSLDRARAGQPAGDREAFDRRAGEEEAQAELLGHRLTVGEAVPAGQTRCIAPVDGFRCVHPAGHAGDHERCGDPGGGIGCPVPGCRHDVPADWPEGRGVGGHAPGCEGWRPPTALGHGRSVPQRCEPGCPRAEQQEDQAEQPDGWGEGVEAADHPVNCSCSPCVIDRLRDSNDTLRDELSGAAGEIDRLRAELGLAPVEQPEER